MLLNARQIQRISGKERIILLAIEDITERREIENGLEKTRKELEATKIAEDEAREYAESIINTVREPLLIAWIRTCGLSPPAAPFMRSSR